jgi:pre-mRNA-processing factor 6
MRGLGPKSRNEYGGNVPNNYVAGLGRGAVGFTTRSDIGPARDAPKPEDEEGGMPPPPMPPPPSMAPPPGMPSAGRGAGTVGGFGKEKETDENEKDYSETNYDEFSGYGGNLFNDTPYDQDDEEADQIYESIDDRMDSRRKRQRELNALEAIKKYRIERPKISDQFADLKTQLREKMTEADWDNIPDAKETNKKEPRRKEIYTPMPDNIISGVADQGTTTNALASRQQRYGGMQTPIGGASTPMSGGWMTPMSGAMTPGGSGTVSQLGEARGTMLGLKLDKMSDSVTGQTVVDPKGYLTDLNSIKISSDAEVGDIKKARWAPPQPQPQPQP